MKNNNKIYIIFIVLFLVFWNPLSFYLLYKNTPVIYIKLIWGVYIFAFVIGIIAIWLIHKNKLDKKWKDFILSFVFAGITWGIIVCTNSSISNINNHEEERGIIFPKNKHLAINKTVEFEYNIFTNNIGLRDRNIDIEKGNKYRILCFGDSWTAGFGVEVENSYPRKLQDYFKDNNIEVINCGREGANPKEYFHFMKKAIPLLKPDLVLVGVLQLDDLAQLFQKKHKLPHKKREKRNFLDKYIKHSIGRIKEKLKTQKEKKYPRQINKNNVAFFSKKVSSYTKGQRLQYESLPDTCKTLYETGNLNSSLLNLYVDFSYRKVVFNTPNHPFTKEAKKYLNNIIKKMKLLCDKHNSKMIFVNLPMATFTGHKIITSPNDIFNEYFKENNNIDGIYRNIAQSNKIPYIELTNHFIELEDKTKYFFKFDYHPNKNGYSEIANYIGEELTKQNIIKLK